MEEDRRLIEETFPIKEVSEESKKEDGKKKHHIKTFHKWWARRPLAASRAVIGSSLINYNKNIQEEIIKISKWDNRNNSLILNDIRKRIKKQFKDKPKVLDCFAGGGAIPLEALRLGCDTYALDYNPVAFTILKSTLEFPQYANKIKEEHSRGLILDLQECVNKINENVEKKLNKFYPIEKDGLAPKGFLWTKVIKCKNPNCNATIPLFKNFWLNRKKRIYLQPIKIGNELSFKIISGYNTNSTNIFDPEKGTIFKGNVTCPFCHSSIKADETHEIFRDRKVNEILYAVITQNKEIRLATKKDQEVFVGIEKLLREEEESFHAILEEDTPGGAGRGAERGFALRRYGVDNWNSLFNSRQKLGLLIIMKEIMKNYETYLLKNFNQDYAKILLVYLALNLDNVCRSCTKFTRYRNDTVAFESIFGRAAIEMVFDYVEDNLIGNSLWKQKFVKMSDVLKDISNIKNNDIHVYNGDATNLEFSDGFFDAVITDPPYYDNMPYAYLSDFYYVWLKHVLKDSFPENFQTILTPKTNEIVVYTYTKTLDEAKSEFEQQLSKSFVEISRVLKQNGIGVVVYAHKTTEGWETLINSLLNSGLIVTAAWPINNTELKGRLAAQNTAALASSIYIVCRKLKKQPHETYGNVKKQMKEYLDEKLDFLWEQDIRGADFFIAAIGSAIEVFGKYEQITDTSDKEIKVPQLLDDVRKMVSEYAINKVLHGEIGGEISTMSRFYILWRAAYGQAKVPYDDARKLATSLGIPNDELNKGFIKQEKDVVRVSGPEDRSIEEIKEPTEMIDVLHKVLILWRNSKKDEYEKLLDETGYAKSDTFRRVGQAISESLPDSQEKKMLDGFLNQYSGGEDASDDKQTKLF